MEQDIIKDFEHLIRQKDQLLAIIFLFSFILPLVVFVGIFFVKNVLIKKIIELRRKDQEELTNLEERMKKRSNGHSITQKHS